MVIKALHYYHFELSHPKTEIWSFVFVFVRETNQYLTAKHWLSWLPVTEKLRKSVLSKVNKVWQEKKIQICCMVRYFYKAILPLSHLYFWWHYRSIHCENHRVHWAVKDTIWCTTPLNQLSLFGLIKEIIGWHMYIALKITWFITNASTAICFFI